MRKDIYEMLVEDYSKESKEELVQRIISLGDIECEDRAFANECLAGNHLKNIDDALQAFEKIADLYHINTQDVHLDKALSSFAFIKKEIVKINDHSRTSKFLEDFKNNMNGGKKVLGFRVYFDGKKFVADEAATEVLVMPSDSTTEWFANKESAYNAVGKHNVDDLKDVKKCKECGEYFWQTDEERIWFADRNMKAPCRCYSCRKKKH